jgi:hypothetical protein
MINRYFTSRSVMTGHIRPMTGHIRPMAGHVQTRSDISSLPGLFTTLSVDSSWVPHRAFTSCFLALMPCTHSSLVFLKEMARGYEHRSKHHHDVSASSSDPSAKPKKLAKRPRPSSYQEESSPEVSPPCGGTPDETECLKMHSPEIHTS